MCKAALDRCTTGLAGEVRPDGVAGNERSPSGLVSTPGVAHHDDRFVPREMHEPVAYVVEAARAVCTGDPASFSGRMALSRQLRDELGVQVEATR